MNRVALVLVALLLVVVPTAAPAPLPSPTPRCAGGDVGAALLSGAFDFTETPDAGTWATWFVRPEDVPVLPAPQVASVTTARELAEIHELQARRDAADLAAVARWDGPATRAWELAFLDLVKTYSRLDPAQNPPRIAREMAILETAMYDALVATWAAKACYQRPPPSALDPAVQPAVDVPAAPSYPSEHAAAAGAASVVLAAFFPDPLGALPRLAEEAAESRVVAGASYRSDVDAGLALGKHVARQVLAARAGDGSATPWDGTGRVTGRCNWEPTAPAFQPTPLEPQWGKVRPFVLASGAQFRPAAPAACDGDAYDAQMRDVYEASRTLTQRQRDVALYWAGGPGSETPPGMNLHEAIRAADRHGLGTMEHARVVAYVAVAEADAGIAAWDAKFTYWGDRPILGIRRTIDPAWSPLLATPPFPGYVSGHSTFSGAAMRVLAGLFPEEAVQYRALAAEAAMSRFYAGIHVREDNEVGLTLGERIGDAVLARAAVDGA